MHSQISLFDEKYSHLRGFCTREDISPLLVTSDSQEVITLIRAILLAFRYFNFSVQTISLIAEKTAIAHLRVQFLGTFHNFGNITMMSPC